MDHSGRAWALREFRPPLTRCTSCRAHQRQDMPARLRRRAHVPGAAALLSLSDSSCGQVGEACPSTRGLRVRESPSYEEEGRLCRPCVRRHTSRARSREENGGHGRGEKGPGKQARATTGGGGWPTHAPEPRVALQQRAGQERSETRRRGFSGLSVSPMTPSYSAGASCGSAKSNRGSTSTRISRSSRMLSCMPIQLRTPTPKFVNAKELLSPGVAPAAYHAASV
mmetsp:Transcript_15712/g.53308  ORF Transcript_15712/g.53308 Transcript_15712/m.53308 type:complete len:225 (+) Transcript_15712:200-874(+)